MAGVNSGGDIRKTFSSETSQWGSDKTDRRELACKRKCDWAHALIEVVARSVVYAVMSDVFFPRTWHSRSRCAPGRRLRVACRTDRAASWWGSRRVASNRIR